MAEEQIVLVADEDARYEAARCAGNVRWSNGVLQQLFIITEFTKKKPTAAREEWRDVPTHQ